MPLIILTGFPASGKSVAADKMKEFFSEKQKQVVVVSEANLLTTDKNSTFADSKAEKDVRGRLKSEVIRLLNKENVVICDGLNYIKGFRYELYCASKAQKTTQITVHCDVSEADARTWNSSRNAEEQYSDEVFSGLCQRYEAPVSTNRWDSPLFLSIKDCDLDLSGMFDCLFNRAAPPPNQSTQCQPLSSTDFLYQLDKQTQDIIAKILEAQKMLGIGSEVKFTGTEETLVLEKTYTLAELARTKRQFINYAKERAIQDVSKLTTMFVQYLRSNLIS